SALIRLIIATPRGVTANRRSKAISCGRRLPIASSARSGSASENISCSPAPFSSAARSRSPGRNSDAPMITVHESATACQLITEPAPCVPIRAVMTPSPPPYRDVTLGDLLARLAGALPQHEALVYVDGPRFTFESLEAEARTIARGLVASGIAPGERVILWATNVPEWIVLQFALAKVGAILVTANTSLRARDVDYLLRQSEAATLVTIGGFREVDYI